MAAQFLTPHPLCILEYKKWQVFDRIDGRNSKHILMVAERDYLVVSSSHHLTYNSQLLNLQPLIYWPTTIDLATFHPWLSHPFSPCCPAPMLHGLVIWLHNSNPSPPIWYVIFYIDGGYSKRGRFWSQESELLRARGWVFEGDRARIDDRDSGIARVWNQDDKTTKRR